jgi:uncharacterized protein (DUF342 family)
MAKTDAGITGEFKLEIDANQTEAVLRFQSGTEQDKHWNAQDIMGLLQARNVAGAKPDEIAKFLETIQKKKEKQSSAVVAKGTPAVEPQPERLAVIDLPVPAAWAGAVEQALKHAPAPHIEIEVQDKVEKEQTVVKKGPLPFLGGKEETVKVVEKVVRKEAVALDMAVLGHCWAAAGTAIGSISPAKPGAPGKTVTGEIIQAAQLPDPKFHIGNELSRKGAELSVTTSGIVRWGRNWVDLIHFADHAVELKLSDDKATCFLDFHPGSKYIPAPTAQGIIEEAGKLGFKPEDLVGPEELKALVDEAVELQQPFNHSLSCAQDAFFEIIVSEDKSKAVLNAVKGSGQGKPLVLKDIGAAINQSGLKFNKDKIKADIPAWFNGPEKMLVGYVLVEGQAPKELPPQTASYPVTFFEKKEYEACLKEIAGFSFAGMESFPKGKISAIAKVDKEQRVCALGPLANGQPGVDVYGQAIPGLPGAPFCFQIYGFLEMAGPSLVVAKRAGILLKAEDQGKTFLACLEHLEGELIIEMADGNMSAYITVNAHRGSGKPIKKADIMAEIAKLGIKKGIEESILEKLAAQSENGVDIQHICFARGKAPEAGSPCELRWLIEFASGQGVTLRQDGTADFRNQDKITKVKKDTALAEILPADHIAMPGWDITGKDLPAPAAVQIPVEAGANIRQQKEPDGRTLLIADTDGELKRDKNKLEIVSAFTIKGNVDAATGNIKFPGAVNIAGDVQAGFYVMAGGEIKIVGSIEAALLSSDQDILIQGGVKGGGKAMLRTKKNILASFIELATVLAVGDIKIKKAMLRSRVKCNGRILMADDAKIIGGEIKTKHGLSVGDLGNPTGVPTKVIFGQDVLIEDQIEVEEKEVAKLQEDIKKVATAMMSSEKLQDKVKLQELFVEKVKLMKMMEKRNLRLFTLKERYEQHFESEIIIKGTAHQGVVVESHGRVHEFHKPAKGIKLSFDTASGRIVEQALTAKT